MHTIERYEDGPLAIRRATEADAYPFWEMAFREENPEWKQWDAPYYAHQALTYEQFEEQQKAQMVNNQARWMIEVDG